VVLIALALVPGAAEAQPPLPFTSRGTVKWNGEDVPEGTQVTAWCDGIQAGITYAETFQEESWYQIRVRSDDPATPEKDGCVNGDEVSYKVSADGLPADQTATWFTSVTVTVNLTAFRPLPSLALQKLVNGVDVEDGQGLPISAGETVTWTYIVSNTGNVALEQIVVVDDQEPGLDCAAATLSLTETLSCTLTGTAISGLYSNLGTAQGVFSSTIYANAVVSDTDRSSYYNGFFIYLPLVVRRASN
jgi:uncharacterized repeat protein (TIGR01451 family)